MLINREENMKILASVKTALLLIPYMLIMSTVGLFLAYNERREEELKMKYDGVKP